MGAVNGAGEESDGAGLEAAMAPPGSARTAATAPPARTTRPRKGPNGERREAVRISQEKRIWGQLGEGQPTRPQAEEQTLPP